MNGILDTLSDISSSNDDEDDETKRDHNHEISDDLSHEFGQPAPTPTTMTTADPDQNDDLAADSSSSLDADGSNQIQPLTKKRKRSRKKPIRNIQILRYWTRRYDLFERFDLGIKMDEESWYSVTPEVVARRQAKMCTCDFLVDVFAGVGGNTIQFAQTCGLVLAIDNNFPRLLMLKHNSQLYGTVKNTMIICGDASRILRALVRERPPKSTNPVPQAETPPTVDDTTIANPLADLTALPGLTSHPVVDCLFMSPPWGGPGYTGIVFPPGSASWNAKRRRQWITDTYQDQEPTKNIQELQVLYDALGQARHLCDRILIYLPRNSSIGQLLQIGWPQNSECPDPQCSCQLCLNVTIEDYCLRGRRLAVGAYLGYFPTIVGRMTETDS